MSNKLAVVYTDGGCRPSRGFGGWGYHGYIFNDIVPNKGTGLKDWIISPKGYIKKDEPLTDKDRSLIWAELPQLLSKNGDVNVLEYIDGMGSLGGDSTNNHAEVVGLRKALEKIVLLDVTEVIVYIDSRFVLDGLTEWVHNWMANGWRKSDGKVVNYVEDWKAIMTLIDEIKAKGINLITDWIKGHINVGNNCADENATMGVIFSRKYLDREHLDTSAASGYWAPKVPVNRMFTHNQWYFNTGLSEVQKTVEGKYIYHIGNHGKEDEMLCKPTADTTYGVLFLEKPMEALEHVRVEQSKLNDGGYSSIVIGKLDVIFKATNQTLINKYSGEALIKEGVKHDLFTPQKTQVTRELRPPRLAFNLVESMRILENLLIDFNSPDRDSKGITVTDITDLIFDVTEVKGKSRMKIKPTMTSAVKYLKPMVKYDTGKLSGEKEVTLTLGIDTPDRNTFNALSERNPKVYVITWRETSQVFRYGMVMEVGADMGIWSGFYSNINLLK